MIVAIQECSAGNESVGHKWVETKIFTDMVPVFEVVDWAKGVSGANGKLILTRPQNSHITEWATTCQ